RARRECLLARFADGKRPPPASGDDLMDTLLDAYRDYWTDSLLKRGDKAALEERLHASVDAARQRLAGALPQPTFALTTQTLQPILEARGFFSITRVPLPYHELMAWRADDTRMYDV